MADEYLSAFSELASKISTCEAEAASARRLTAALMTDAQLRAVANAENLLQVAAQKYRALAAGAIK